MRTPEDIFNAEISRLSFIYNRDGVEKTMQFSKQTYESYKKARTLAKRIKSGYGREYRKELVISMVALRKYFTGRLKIN